MAPAAGRGGGGGRRSRKKTQYKRFDPSAAHQKKQEKEKSVQEHFLYTPKNSIKPVEKLEVEGDNGGDTISTTTASGCCTPKAQRFRIPECSTCPPAPKKQRRLATTLRCSSQRSSNISFFTPPDLELFFLFSSCS